MGFLRPLTAVVMLALPAAAEVTVTPQGERLNLRAVAAPLADVLEQLSKSTGMKVIYEGAAPRVPVTLTLEARTPVQAVLAVMEGQGLNFALRSDAAGQRVDRLVIAGQAQAAPAAPGSKTAAAPPPPNPLPPEKVVIDGDPENEEEQAPPPQVQLPNPTTRGVQPPPAAPSFQPPPTPSYPNSPFAPRAPQVAPQTAPPPPEEDEKELD